MAITNKATVQYNDNLPDSSKTPQTKVSNIVTTEFLSELVRVSRTSAKAFVIEGETAVQTAVITNDSSASMTGILYKDTLNAGAAFTAGSVTINGTSYPGFDPAVGFAVPNIASKSTVQIQYSISTPTPLVNANIISFATVTYTILDPIAGSVNFTASSNAVNLGVVSLALTIVKSVNKAFAVSSTRLHYTIVITNTGTAKKSDLIFTDPIPTGTNFVSGSVKINGAVQPTANPTAGFALPDMIAAAIITVEFETIVS